jgi:CHAD domain-containing protein
MMRSPVSFLIDSEAGEQETQLSLQARLPTHIENATSLRETFYDTFDWRLYRAGVTLTARPDNSGVLLTCTAAGEASALRLDTPGVPAFAWDLPLGPFSRTISDLIQMRRLLPLVSIQTEGRLLSILDDLDKTVARVLLERGASLDPGRPGDPVPLPTILHVLPIKGYVDEFKTVVSFVETGIGLPRLTDSVLELALAAVDRVPGDYSSKLRLRLGPDMRADEAARLIHRTLLATMDANEEGTRADLDSEFLHDFRVAGRRTRSALRQIKGVYPPQVVDHFSAEFRWLGQITGPTRDLDVYLLKMADYEATLPDDVAEDLQPLVQFLRERQRDEQRRMASALGDKRYRALIDSWRSFLAERVPENTDLPNAARPVREVASERIWRSYRRVRSRGRAIKPSTPAEALHRLRIDCKKLRYLLEFFRSLYDAEEIDLLVKALKRLQDNLGDFNDYEVQQLNLREFADEMSLTGTVPAGALMAMGRLVERLEAGQAEERRRFAERFGRFAAKENHARFKRLFKTTRGIRKGTAEEDRLAAMSTAADPDPASSASDDSQVEP